MALSIIVLEKFIDDPTMVQLAGSFQRRSSSNVEHPLGTIYQFSGSGEGKFTKDAYAACNAYQCVMDSGMFFHVFTEALKDNLVPVAWPDSKDAEGERISYENYFRLHADLGDGTFLFRIQRRVRGTSTGWMALSDADRLTFQADLCTGDGEQLLVKSQGLALVSPSEEGM